MTQTIPDDSPGTPSPLVVGLGEVLFDCFEDRTVLGGAPLNFAFHAQQLLSLYGGQGAPVSRVGSDGLGKRLLRELTDRNLTTEFIQTDPQLPTGTVQVTLDDQGQPEYEITEGVAWDALESSPEFLQLAKRCDAVCFGTLAQRSPQSRQAIRSFLSAATQALRVLDINLRQNFYDAEIVQESFELAQVVKLNEEELEVVWRLLGLDESAQPSVDAKAFYLAEKFQLNAIVFTRGSAGTLLFAENRRVEGALGTYNPVENADSVGAGDACCAAITSGLLLQWPSEKVVSLANRVGAYVASQTGATPVLPGGIVGGA